MNILTLKNVSLAFGHHPLLSNVDLQIKNNERICLVGRNGTGKSTLFGVLNASIQADDGEIWRQDTLRISHLEQEIPTQIDNTIFEVVVSGLGQLGQLLAEYHLVTHQLEDPNLDQQSQLIEKLHHVQQKIESMDGWSLNQKVDTTLSKLFLPADKPFLECSGGVKRRILLARALVSEPDLLLLDEPTNHMDISAITWLEEYLTTFGGTLIFITHDRTFAKNLANRIVELDRGTLSSYNGDYSYYLQKKEEQLQAEEQINKKFDKKLAEQEIWIRKGIKARRTRNEGRVRKLEAMREEKRSRIGQQGQVSFSLNQAASSGKVVVDLDSIGIGYDKPVIADFSCRIMRGDRVGIIGPNGCGKSTLLKIILGKLKPDSGTVIMGSKLQLAYYDQQRELLDLSKTVRDNICEGRDFVDVRGQSRHVISYLQDFLFPAQRVDSPVKVLSGGERNRLLLAKLFTQPANLMILDEPTNDLDMDTLELLEDLLADFDGTLILVSHDRTFLDNIVTSTIVFEGNATVQEYVGGYEDWVRQSKRSQPQKVQTAKNQPKDDKSSSPEKKSGKKTKLGYKLQRELSDLPKLIENLEKQVRLLEESINSKTFYQQEKQTIAETLDKLKHTQLELEKAYKRWEELENESS